MLRGNSTCSGSLQACCCCLRYAGLPQAHPVVLSLHLPRCSEDVLWSALFVLAVVARDTSDKFVSHMLQLVKVGVLPALEHALAAYRQTMDAQVGCWLGRPTRRTVGLNRRSQRACYYAAA